MSTKPLNKIHKNVSILFASAVWPIFFPCVKTIVDGQAPGRPMGTASWTKNSWNCVGQNPSIFVSFILCKYTCLYFMWFPNVSYACSGRLRLIIAWNIIFFLGSKNHLLGPGGVSMWFWVVFPPKSNRGFLHRPAWVGQGGWAKLGWQKFSNQKSVYVVIECCLDIGKSTQETTTWMNMTFYDLIIPYFRLFWIGGLFYWDVDQVIVRLYALGVHMALPVLRMDFALQNP